MDCEKEREMLTKLNLLYEYSKDVDKLVSKMYELAVDLGMNELARFLDGIDIEINEKLPINYLDERK